MNKIQQAADYLYDHGVIRVGFRKPPEARLNVASMIRIETTTPDRARELISKAARQLKKDHPGYATGDGIATHRRNGYVIGHWRIVGSRRCLCDRK